jgi:membrane-associated protease RseP (regulator of RpoE activity)
MAFVLLWGLFVFIGWPQANAVAVTGFVPVSHGVDPARAAGIEPGDVVVSVGGVPVHSPQELQRLISTRARQPVTVVVERGGQSRAVVVTPQADPALHGANGRIGVEIGPPVARSNPGIALGRSSHLLGQFVTGSFSAMGHVFSASGISSYLHDLTNAHAANQAAHSGDRISSIYGAARLAVQGAQAGAAQLILVLVTIIVFVGILNLFPMLPLDGGHVLIAVYEKIRSRRGRLYHADVTKLMPVAYAFVLLLGFIVVSSLYLDITHPIVNRFQ